MFKKHGQSNSSMPFQLILSSWFLMEHELSPGCLRKLVAGTTQKYLREFGISSCAA